MRDRVASIENIVKLSVWLPVHKPLLL